MNIQTEDINKRPERVRIYEYSKDWTAHDFYGKYHLARVRNPAPVPGTQMLLDQEHKAKKEADIKRFEAETEARILATRKRLHLKDKSAKFTTRVHVHTVIGEPSEQAENVIQENEDIATTKIVFPDSKVQISRFMKNISLGRAHYVSFAITTGYKSVNWQEPTQLGYTALHIATSKGYADVAEELLKYGADPNIRSGIGNFPIHDSWNFWRLPADRKERELQEERTCEVLRVLCKYNANADGPMNDGNTALHIAAQKGPVKAVRVLLGFKADHYQRNKDGRTPMDVAADCGNDEILRLLNFWDGIKSQMVNVDFVIQWQHFLKDYEAVISSGADMSVEKIMFQLNMQENMRLQNMTDITKFKVDDKHLLQCKRENLLHQKMKNREAAMRIADEEAKEDENVVVVEPGSWQSLIATGPKKFKSKRRNMTPVQEYYHSLIDRNKPPLPSISQIDQNKADRAEVRAIEDGIDVESSCSGKKGGDEEGDSQTNENGKGEEFSRPKSKLERRRLRMAGKVALDAKFELFTARPCTASALSLSRRVNDAPLKGTPEEFSLSRYLTTPNRTRQLIVDGQRAESQTKSVKKQITQTTVSKRIVNHLGSYCKAADAIADPTYRQLLYDRIADDSEESAKKEAANMREVSNFNKLNPNKINSDWRGTKIDMNPTEKRSLFVSKDLVPPQKELSALAELKEKLKEEHVRDDTSSAQDGSISDQLDESSLDIVKEREREKLKKERLAKKKAQYGEGRLTSTHNVKKIVEVPWSTVKSNFNVAFSM